MEDKYHSNRAEILNSALVACGFFMLALSLRLFNLDHGLYVDELYHLLAARSASVDGSLAIADGEYTRAAFYSRFLAFLFGLFGEGLNVARLSSAVTGSLFVSLLYVSVRWMAGHREAIAASLVVCVMPSMIYPSQFVRFYALHQMLFWVGAIGVYAVLTANRRKLSTGIIGGTAVIGLALAYYFQVTTVIGVVALYSWAILYLIHRTSVGERSAGSWGTYFLYGLLVAGSAGAAFVLMSGKSEELWNAARHVAPWNKENRDHILYYYRFFIDQYPTFWTLFPVASAVAVYTRPRLAFFCFWIFSVGIAMHSIAGMKDERYVIYLLPFIVIIWSICAVSLIPKLAGLIDDILSEQFHLGSKGIGTRAVSVVMLFFIGGLVLLSNPAFRTSFQMLSGQEYRHEVGDWSLSSQIVQPLIDEADVVLTTNETETQYYFGHFDFAFSRYRLLEAAHSKSPDEFTIDSRTGRPVISSVKSLELIVNCFRKGIFFGDSRRWYREGLGLGAEGVKVLMESADEVEVNPESKLVVFTWTRQSAVSEDKCSIARQYMHSD